MIARLPEDLNTYLERPVRDEYVGLPEEKRKLFNQKVVGGLEGYTDDTTKQELSGGQMQRLAVARTFMRSSTMEEEVGLLLFDEPSASLDPTAEHGTINVRHLCLVSEPFFSRSLLTSSKVAR